MKKVLKYVGIALGIIAFLVLCAALFINIKGIPTYDTMEPEVQIEMDSFSVANGHRLTSMICAGCHRAEDGSLTGRLLNDIPPSFGKTWSQNITKHETNGLGRYSNGELIYLLRTGIKRDGAYCPPWMPSYPIMSDDDLHDIIAFLRSDHPMTAPSDKVQPAPEPSFLVKFLSRVAFKPTPYPDGPIVAPDTNDMVAFGEYILNGLSGCYQCHSAAFETNDLMVPKDSEGYLAGGNILTDPEGNQIPSANLTMHETGLKGWTLEQFEQAVRFGQRPNGTALSHAMPPHPELSSKEVSAIWAYLQSVEPVDNAVARVTID